MRTLATLAVAVGLVGLVGSAPADDKKDSPAGTWKWTTEFGGQKREQTLKLELKDGKLTGTLSGGKGDTKIEDATFKDGEVKFTVTRERGGMKIVSKYSGKVSGDTIKGTVESDRDGKSDKRDWEAKRAKVMD